MGMVEIRGLIKRFGTTEVLRGIDLTVETGEVLAIVGPSGSGKTTLLRCLNFLETPTAGLIRVGGIEIDAAEPAARRKAKVRELRQHIGFVFQGFNLFPHRTALENVIEGPVVVKREPRAAAEERGRQLLAKVGLAERADAYPGRLSGGQQQRVAIARAVAAGQSLLLLDEVTSALDPELVGEVLSLVKELRDEGTTIVMATHEMAFAREVADRVVFLDDGVVCESGPPEQVLRDPVEQRTREYLARFLD